MTDLNKLQALVHEVRKERGFTMDPLKIFALLAEEMGEVAAELKRTWSANYQPFEAADLQDELADLTVLTLALANQFNIDLEAALREKLIGKDGKRHWKTAQEGR